MASAIEEKLAQLGIQLPKAPTAVGAYVTWARTGNLLVTSGQLPWKDGKMAYPGKIGSEVTPDEGYQAARLAGLNALAQFRDALGSLDKIQRIFRLESYVHSAPGFQGQPKVLDGASELMEAVFGERGRHTRTAVPTHEMPLNAAIQLIVWAEVRD